MAYLLGVSVSSSWLFLADRYMESQLALLGVRLSRTVLSFQVLEARPIAITKGNTEESLCLGLCLMWGLQNITIFLLE